MAIQIQTVWAQVGVDRTPFNLAIQTKQARLELHQEQAKVNISTELPRVLIDQYESFASAGLKNNGDLIKQAAQRGYQQAMQFIGTTAQDGKRLAAIENGGNPIAEIAIRDSNPTHQFGLDYIPKVGPKITVTGDVAFDPERNSGGVHNGVQGSFTPGEVSINFTPSKVSIYLKQYPSINVDYVGTNIDTYR